MTGLSVKVSPLQARALFPSRPRLPHGVRHTVSACQRGSGQPSSFQGGKDSPGGGAARAEAPGGEAWDSLLETHLPRPEPRAQAGTADAVSREARKHEGARGAGSVPQVGGRGAHCPPRPTPARTCFCIIRKLEDSFPLF